MMGAADEIPQAPKDKITFVEDMSENELATALDLPCGLTNLGNTCYLNATVQCLKTVPELKEALSKFTGHLTLSEHEGPQNITVALRDMLQSMESQSTIVPVILVQVLHMIFPRFAEKSEHGGFMQQDANECWTELLRMLQQKLKPITTNGGNAVVSGAAAVRSFVDQYFGGRYKVTMKNIECEDEPVSHSTEDFLQLSCFISQETRYMQAGIKSSLEEKITKHSPKLGSDATYLKTCKIDRLPAYLTIQFVRFRYKEKASTNAKILKDIKFSINLDVFELCTEELQKKLMPMRELFKEDEDRRALEASSDKGKNKQSSGESSSEKKDESVTKYKHPFSFPDDLGSNNSGYYTLQAVLTHLGRSSSSGHYVAWVKGKNNEWFKCDDDTVSLISEEEILKLSGGGKESKCKHRHDHVFVFIFCLSVIGNFILLPWTVYRLDISYICVYNIFYNCSVPICMKGDTVHVTRDSHPLLFFLPLFLCPRCFL